MLGGVAAWSMLRVRQGVLVGSEGRRGTHGRCCRELQPAQHSDRRISILHDYESARSLKQRRRFDDEDTFQKRYSRDEFDRLPDPDSVYEDELLGGADRWSTWRDSSPLQRGPEPYPDWLPLDDAAVDTELGILKTGKEADVY